MSLLSPSTANRASLPPLPVRRFTVDEYHRMIETGILRSGDPVELLDGWLVLKMTRNPPHDVALSLAEERIAELLPGDWFRRVQMAITLPESEPEPDLVVVRGPRRRYASRHPGPQDIALVVEVADATLESDRTEKGRIYARAGIAVYWIINLPDSRVEVYSEPSGPGRAPRYRRRHIYGAARSVPLVLHGRNVGQMHVRDLLP
jgi:Uma2 family endonuclease